MNILKFSLLVSILLLNAYGLENNVTIAKLKNTTVFQKKYHYALIGTWYGNQKTNDGGFREEISHKYANGKYKLYFRMHNKDGSYYDQIEVGEWGLSGNIYFSIFKGWIDVDSNKFIPSDQSDPFTRDAYRILKLTDKEFVYESLDIKYKFINKKVPSNFKFKNKSL